MCAPFPVFESMDSSFERKYRYPGDTPMRYFIACSSGINGDISISAHLHADVCMCMFMRK